MSPSGDRHSEEVHSENGQRGEKTGDRLKLSEKNVKHRRVNICSSETPLAVTKVRDSATKSKKHNHTIQEALEHHMCTTTQESYSKKTSYTDLLASLPDATYNNQFGRQNGRARLPKGRVSAADRRRTRVADWENIQRGKQNEANWCWREYSAAAGDWACQNKAEMRETKNRRSKKNHCGDQGVSGKNECRPNEGIDCLLLRNTEGHRITVNDSRPNGRVEGERVTHQQHGKPSRKERSRGRLYRNWRRKKDKSENLLESMNEGYHRQGDIVFL